MTSPTSGDKPDTTQRSNVGASGASDGVSEHSGPEGHRPRGRSGAFPKATDATEKAQAVRAKAVVVRIDGDGRLVDRPRGDTKLLGEGSVVSGATDVGAVFDVAGAKAIVDRARVCLEFGVTVEGEIDGAAAGVLRRWHVLISPDLSTAQEPVCVVKLWDSFVPRVDESAEAAGWQSTVGLASGLAHRLNNLLVSITGNAGLLRDALPEDHPDQAAVQDMDQAAREMSALTRHLLAYAGGGRYCTKRVSINQLVDHAVAIVNPSSYPTVKIIRDLGHNLSSIDVDPGQIEQAIVNLLMNGLEAIGDKPGEVELITRRVKDPNWVDCSGMPAACIVLSVRDSGPGMTEAVRARVFEPFFTTKAPGRGLGLPAVLGIVRGHDGTVRVQAGPGGGTLVEIILPTAEAVRRNGSSAPIGEANKGQVGDDYRG